MKILFAGLGSIGQRHLQNIKKTKYPLEIFALIRKPDMENVIENCKLTKVKSMPEYYNIKPVFSLNEAKKIKPDIVFITNPSAFHVKTALEFAKLGSDLFIEKPLGNDLKGLDELEKIISRKKLISYVGYQQRFNPLVDEIKKIIKKNSEKIISVSFEWNSFMPYYHKYEDYTKTYAARKELGGGVILVSIHEIDLIYNFFGMPKKIIAVGGKLSDLKINVEDTVMAFLMYNFPVYLNLSFAQTKEVRKFKVQFKDSTLFADLMENKYELYNKEGSLVKTYQEKTTRDEMFIKEDEYFLDCVKKRKKTFLDIKEGRKSLEIALKIKKSIKNN